MILLNVSDNCFQIVYFYLRWYYLHEADADLPLDHNAISFADTELSREIEQTIEQADGSAYMAIFVTTSTSYTPPAKYFKDAKIEIERCAKSMDDLASMVGIKF